MIVKPFQEQAHFTTMHNLLFDVVMPVVSPIAWKALSFIVRNTKGRQVRSEGFSYDEIMEGTGVGGRDALSAALKELLSDEIFGCSVLLRKEGTRCGAASGKMRYALNRNFSVNPQGVDRTRAKAIKRKIRAAKKQGANSPENGLKNSPESGLTKNNNSPENGLKNSPESGLTISSAYKDRAPDKTSTKKTIRPEEEEETRARDDSPSSSSSSDSIEILEPRSLEWFESNPLFRAFCDICGLPSSWQHLRPEKREHLVAATLWVAQQSGTHYPDMATTARQFFAGWDMPTPPHPSQLIENWKRMALIAERKNALEVNENGTGTHRPNLTAAEKRSAATQQYFDGLAQRKADLERRQREFAEREAERELAGSP